MAAKKPPKKVKWGTPVTQELSRIGHELVIMASEISGRPSRISAVDCVIEDCTGKKGFASEVLTMERGGNRVIYDALRGPYGVRLHQFFNVKLRATRLELVKMLISGSSIQKTLKPGKNLTEQEAQSRTMIHRMRQEYEAAVLKIRDMCHMGMEESDAPLSDEFPALAELTGMSNGEIGVTELTSDMFDLDGMPVSNFGPAAADKKYVWDSLDALEHGDAPKPPAFHAPMDPVVRNRYIDEYTKILGRPLTDPELADIINGIGYTDVGAQFPKFVEAYSVIDSIHAPKPEMNLGVEGEPEKDDPKPIPVHSEPVSGPVQEATPIPAEEEVVPTDVIEPDTRDPDTLLNQSNPNVRMLMKIRDTLQNTSDQIQKYRNIVEFGEHCSLTDCVIYFRSPESTKFVVSAIIQLRATGRLDKLNLTAIQQSTTAFKKKLAKELEIPVDLIEADAELIESDETFSEFINDVYGGYAGIDEGRTIIVQNCAAIAAIYLYRTLGANYRVGYQVSSEIPDVENPADFTANYTIYPKKEDTDYAKMAADINAFCDDEDIIRFFEVDLYPSLAFGVPWFHSFSIVVVPDYLTAYDDPELNGVRSTFGNEIFSRVKSRFVDGITDIIKKVVPTETVSSEVTSRDVDENLSFDLNFKIPGPLNEAKQREIERAIDLTMYSDRGMTMAFAPISSSIVANALVEVIE